MSYAVQITPSALKDMQAIHDYIASVLLAPEYAYGQYHRIADAILSLKEMPERYPLVRFEPEHTMGLHRMPVDNYSVFFVISQDAVVVTSGLYTASDVEGRLGHS